MGTSSLITRFPCLASATKGPLLDRLRVFRDCRLLALIFAIASLPAVYWGWTVYYRHQFENTAVALWPFVSDSPNAVLSFVIVLVMAVFGLRAAGLDLLAWILNIKVGLWSAFVLLYWYDDFFDHDAGLRWALFWLHLGMVAQAFVLHHEMRTRPPGRTAFIIVAALVGLDVVLDYGFGHHPDTLPPDGTTYGFASVVGLVTTALTLACFALALKLYPPRRSPNSTIGPVS